MSEFTGPLTFLFTDIEGSTFLWDRFPEEMHRAHARHGEIIQQSVEQTGGTLVRERGEGDSTFSVFSDPSAAAAAALSIQRRLHQETPTGKVHIRVRIGLHTGAAYASSDDFNSSAVNRCARLRAIAHGGQTLLSGATAELVQETLPPAASLRYLGNHRLRDLQRPEQVFELLHPDIPANYPPVKSLDSMPNNLPQQLTSFIGREEELLQIRQLLKKTRLLTIAGAGGAGKTRLALEIGAEVLEEYADGVWIIELASLSDAANIAQTIGMALGLSQESRQSPEAILISHLLPRHLLLILDNCEHLIEGCAKICSRLLAACPHLTILATSRESLAVSGEVVRRIPSLSLPPEEDLSAPEARQYESVRLFEERVTLVAPEFAAARHIPAIGRICRRLDGIPFAIELAAARVRILPPEQIADRLDDRFRFLTGGSRVALPRQQTLRALMDWSYDLLTEAEKLLLCRLSVFAGGWTLEAAEAVCADARLASWEVLDGLTSLADKSLILADMDEASVASGSLSPRYRALETIRHYGRERLAEQGETVPVQNRHRDYFYQLVKKAEPELRGAHQTLWMSRLEEECDNIRAALDRALVQGPPELLLDFTGSLWRFWEVRGYSREGLKTLKSALAQPGAEARNRIRARALTSAGIMAWRQGEFEEARALYEESMEIRREMGDTRGCANNLNNLGLLARNRGDNAEARRLYEASLALFRECEDESGIALALGNLGEIADVQGDAEDAIRYSVEALQIYERLGDTVGTALSLVNLGMAVQQKGDTAGARAHYERSLKMQREVGNRQGVALALNHLGELHIQTGELECALVLLQECLQIRQELEDREGIAYAFEALAQYAFARNADAQALTLLGAADTLREVIGSKRSGIESIAYEDIIARLRERLGSDRPAAIGNELRSLSDDSVLLLALEQLKTL